MTQEELLKRVRKIEIKTRSLSKNIFAGEYRSQFKGRGMSFAEVREYQPGDDVRSIDWNVTARLNKPYIKIFEEERELTVMLLVDVSGSRNFGTLSQSKKDMMAEVAATLAFSTIENNDKVGVIFFSDKIEQFIPPKKGKTHVLRIISQLLNFEPTSSGTDINQALQYMTNAMKRHCTVFLISDCLDAQFTAAPKRGETIPLLIAAHRHTISLIQIYDQRDAALPNVGLIKVKDAETQEDVWLDTAVGSVRQAYEQSWRNNQRQLDNLLTRTGTKNIAIRTNEDYVKKLMMLFKQ
ncbi:MAG: DUF58 domain-containing protein [Bacteroidales bacterium]|nr:DUF58 domain-containing protein [Bacteroidales bacterium]